MLQKFIPKILPLFDTKKVNSRSRNISKNVVGSLLLKGVSIGISFLLVPMAIGYLDKERYGIWLTISSIISWFTLFDIGLGNGFRNKFSEALALNNQPLAKSYVSTTFALLSIIIGVVLLVFFVINPFLDWNSILKADMINHNELSLLIIIVFSFFCLQFVFKLTNSILLADQKSAIVDGISAVGSLLSIGIIYLLMQLTEGSLLLMGLTLSACPVLAMFVAYLIVFNGKYRIYKPALKYIDFSQSKSLMGLGILFFIPQVASLVIFSTSNIIIIQIFSPADVTVYNNASKYFSLTTLFFQILLTPFWSAFTEAFVKEDIRWIKNSINKLVRIWVLSCLAVVVMVFASDFVYKLWLGKQLEEIPFQLTVVLAVYVCISNWNNIFTYFCMGVSKIYLQVWLLAIGGILFIPLAVGLTRSMGLIGIPIAMGLSILPGSLAAPIQYRKIINKTARGIWNK
jgi:O-antigen/teichoic acid export membrane protein